MAPKAAPFRLLVITPEGLYPQETLWVKRLFEQGLETLHLRKPGWPKEQLIQYLEEIDEDLHTRVMVHYEPLLLEHFKLKGVHYPLPTLPYVKPVHKVSCPVHSWDEFSAAEERVDYALLSPFFSSISKKGYAANKQLHVPPAGARLQKVVALGGIAEDKIDTLKQLEVGGAALLGAVWQTADPLAAFLRIQERVKNA